MSDNSREIYLDNNATTRSLPEVAEAVAGILTSGYGNPSSAHQRGSRAREALELARQQVASLVGTSPDRILFTSGGTESNNIALNLLAEETATRLVTTATEHSSVLLKAAVFEENGIDVTYLPVDGAGLTSPEVLEDALAEPASLVSIHWVNNETGVVQPVKELGKICGEYGVPFHVDAAQAVGKIRVDFDAMPIDILTFSAHKIHGPQGVGAVCFREIGNIFPLTFGGDQEHRARPGTENLPGIVGFGEAARIRGKNFSEIKGRVENLRNGFERRLLDSFPGLCVNGLAANRVCNTTNIRFPGIDGMALMALLDSEGVICSQTSACHSRRPEPSHVLLAMGLSTEEAFASVRFSFSGLNTEQEAQTAADRVTEVYGKLLEFERLGA